MAYLGNGPGEAYTNTVKDSFNGDGSTTAFTMSVPSTTNDVRVVVENVIQDPTVAYSCSGTTLTFTSAPPSGTANIYVIHLGLAVMTTIPPSEIADATTFSSSVTVQGAFSADGGTIKLDGNYPTGSHNVALGNTALSSGSLSGSNNVALGSNSLASNTSGGQNIGIGRNALDANTTAENNIGIGHSVLTLNSTGGNNVAIGREALQANTTASNNIAVGYQSMFSNTTATEGTAVGVQALYSNTTGVTNTAVGRRALYSNTTGFQNVGLGARALNSNTDGDRNVAVGMDAGYSNSVGINNTFVGSGTGYSTTGGGNTFIGSYGSSGGYGCGYYMTTGNNNTIIGAYTGNSGGLDLRTSSSNIVISDGSGNPRIYVASSGCVSIGTVSTTTDTVSRFGGSSSKYSQKMVNSYGGGTAVYADNNDNQSWIFARFNTNNSLVGYISVGTSSTNYVTSSDYRLKENVVDLTSATDRLKQLEPKRFNFIADADTTVDGFLAHEVQSVVPEAITGEKDAVDADGNPDYQGIDQSKLVPLLVATIKELEARIATLEG